MKKNCADIVYPSLYYRLFILYTKTRFFYVIRYKLFLSCATSIEQDGCISSASFCRCNTRTCPSTSCRTAISLQCTPHNVSENVSLAWLKRKTRAPMKASRRNWLWSTFQANCVFLRVPASFFPFASFLFPLSLHEN